MGFFGKIKEKLKKTKEAIAYKLNKLFTGGVLTDDQDLTSSDEHGNMFSLRGG